MLVQRNSLDGPDGEEAFNGRGNKVPLGLVPRNRTCEEDSRGVEWNSSERLEETNSLTQASDVETSHCPANRARRPPIGPSGGGLEGPIERPAPASPKGILCLEFAPLSDLRILLLGSGLKGQLIMRLEEAGVRGMKGLGPWIRGVERITLLRD